MRKRFCLGLLLLVTLFCSLAFSACSSSAECEHEYGSLVSAVEATCTENGAVAHYSCSKCNKNFDQDKNEVESVVIPATGHSASAEWTTAENKHYHTCLNGCDAKLDEAFCQGGTATCTQLASCEVCLKAYGDLASHNFSITKYDDNGHWQECACGEKNTSHTHDYTTDVDAPTCTEPGCITYTCSCGSLKAEHDQAATGHSFATTYSSNDGYHWFASTCEHSAEIHSYAPHDYDDGVVTDPTCITQGYTTYTCDCGYSYRDDYVDALGHSANLVETSSTLFDSSKCLYLVTYGGTCTRCSCTVTETKNIERHSFFEKIITPATCQTEGQKGQFCSAENCIYHQTAYSTTSYEDANAHTWEEQVVGSGNYKCSATNCDATKQKAETEATVSGGDLANLGEVEFDEATIGLNDGLKDALNGKGVTITAGTLGENDRNDLLADPDVEAAVGNKPIYEFTMNAEEESFDSSNFGEEAAATIRIPYTLVDGEDPACIIVWHITSDGALEAIEAVYSEDAEGNGFVTFTTNHFSSFSVATADPETLCAEFGHDQNNLLTVEATCTTEGYTVCLRCSKRVEGSTVAAKGHAWHSEVEGQATCSQNGVIKYTCSCGASYSAVVPATGHNYVQSAKVTATCKNGGSVTFTCTHCEESYTVTTPRLSHSYLSVTVDPTCTEIGYTDKTCTLCGEVVRLNVRPANGHNYDNVWHHDASSHYRACTVCGEKGEASAHIAGPVATEQSAQICTVCERVLQPAIQHVHDLERVEAKDATCTEGGNVEYYTCDCNKWFLDAGATQLITDHSSVLQPATGHSYQNMPAVDATCEEVGYTQGVRCTECDYLRGHVEISALGHDYVINSQTAPTCDEDGEITYICSHCGDDEGKDSETISKLGHKYISVITAPTCTEGGYTTHTCTRCNDKYTDNEKAALGHSWSADYESDEDGHWKSCVRCQSADVATAHTPNYGEATSEHGVNCVKCGYVIAEALEHTHSVNSAVTATPSSCDSAGNIAYYTCTCGEWFYDQECTRVINNHASVIAPALGHDLEFHERKDSTCTVKGYEQFFECKRCHWQSEHQEIELKAHVFETPRFDDDNHWLKCNNCDATDSVTAHVYQTVITAPTCTEGGYTTYTCVCGHTYTDDETEALGHNYGEFTSNDDGTHTRVCENDSEHTETEDCVYATVTTAPTCTEGGYTTYTCDCGHTYTDDETEAIGHNYGEITSNGDGTHTRVCANDSEHTETEDCEYTSQVTAPTCTEQGYTTYTCACGHRYVDDYTNAIDHNYGEFTSNNNGTHTRVCANDSEHTETEDCEYTSQVTAPTCTEDGFTTYTCDCGYSYNGDFIDATGHSYQDGVCHCGAEEGSQAIYTYEEIFTETTTTGTVVEGKIVIEFMPGNIAIAYEYDVDSSTGEFVLEWQEQAYWAQSGNILILYTDAELTVNVDTYMITESGEIEEYTCQEHTYEIVENTPPTCTMEGYIRKKCTVCGHGEGSSLPVLEHSFVDGVCTECDAREEGELPGQLPVYNCTIGGIGPNGEAIQAEFLFYANGALDYKQYIVVDGNSIFDNGLTGSWVMQEGFIVAHLRGETLYFTVDEYGGLTMVESQQPPQGDTVSYTYQEIMTDSSGGVTKGEILFMEGGIAKVNTYVPNETGEFALEYSFTAFWRLEGSLIKLFQDDTCNQSIGVFSVDENGVVSQYICTEHQYVADYRAATCSQEGFDGVRCSICGVGQGAVLPAIDHNYDDNGCCVMCGANQNQNPGGNEDVESYREETLRNMNDTLTAISNMGIIIESPYSESFEAMYNAVEKAESVDQIYEIYNEFMNLAEQLAKGEEGETIVEEVLVGEEPVMVVGSDVAEFIANNIVGRTLLITASQSGQHSFTVTSEMITVRETGARVGEYIYIEIAYENEYVSSSYYLDVLIIPDMAGATLLYTYNADCIYGYSENMSATMYLYDNGYAKTVIEYNMYGESGTATVYTEYSLSENVLSMTEDGMVTLFIANNQTWELETYVPTGEVIGEYTFVSYGTTLTFTVYGEYESAGDYIALVQIRDEDMNSNFATYVYLDKENSKFRSLAIDGTLYSIDDNGNIYCNHDYLVFEQRDPDCINGGYAEKRCQICGDTQYEDYPALGHSPDENGVCTKCGSSGSYDKDDSVDVGAMSQRYMGYASERWANLCSSYVITQEQSETYENYYNRLQNATSAGELQDILVQLESFLAEIDGGARVNELEPMRQEIQNQMTNEWSALEQSGYDITQSLTDTFETIYQNVGNANSLVELEELEEKIASFFRSIKQDIENNKEEIIDVNIEGLDDFCYEGQDLEQFIEDNIVGENLTVYTTADVYTYVITREMITYVGSTAEVGAVLRVSIHYSSIGGGTNTITFPFRVLKDLTGVQMVGSYDARCIYNYMEGLTMTLELYANGYAMIYGQMGEESMMDQMTYTLDGDVLELPIDGVNVIFIIDEQNEAIVPFAPEGTSFGDYSYDNGYGTLTTFAVYGEYTGADNYISLVTLNQDGFTTTLTVYVYLDKENSIFRCGVLGEGTFDITDKGVLVCQHSYNEYGSCIYCNQGSSGSTEVVRPTTPSVDLTN